MQVAVWLYKTFGPRPFLANAVLKTLLTPAVRTSDPAAVDIVRQAFMGANRKQLGIAMDAVMLGRPDLVAAYNALSTPRLMLVGEEDEVWSPSVATRVTEQSPTSLIGTISEASHIPPLEQPQATASAILDFWNQLTQVNEEATTIPIGAFR